MQQELARVCDQNRGSENYLWCAVIQLLFFRFLDISFEIFVTFSGAYQSQMRTNSVKLDRAISPSRFLRHLGRQRRAPSRRNRPGHKIKYILYNAGLLNTVLVFGFIGF